MRAIQAYNNQGREISLSLSLSPPISLPPSSSFSLCCLPWVCSFWSVSEVCVCARTCLSKIPLFVCPSVPPVLFCLPVFQATLSFFCTCARSSVSLSLVLCSACPPFTLWQESQCTLTVIMRNLAKSKSSPRWPLESFGRQDRSRNKPSWTDSLHSRPSAGATGLSPPDLPSCPYPLESHLSSTRFGPVSPL